MKETTPEFIEQAEVPRESVRELQKQLGHLNLLIAETKKAEKAAALAAFREQVKLYDISEMEVMSTLGYIRQAKKSRPAKYYDPSSGRSWSGYGPKPKWLEDKNPNDYLVDRTPQPWWPEDAGD